MTIGAVLQAKGSEVVTVERAQPLTEVLKLLAARRIGAVPVTDGGGVAGIFSERDLIHGLDRHGAAFLERSVGEAMTAPAISVDRSAPVLSALALMTQRRIRHLPVMEGGQLVGFVSIGDLVAYRITAIEREADAMRSYIQGS